MGEYIDQVIAQRANALAVWLPRVLATMIAEYGRIDISLELWGLIASSRCVVISSKRQQWSVAFYRYPGSRGQTIMIDAGYMTLRRCTHKLVREITDGSSPNSAKFLTNAGVDLAALRRKIAKLLM